MKLEDILQIEPPKVVVEGGEDFPKSYLGDAVYASFDGYHIWLITGDRNNQRIALEPSVYTALERYAETVWNLRSK